MTIDEQVRARIERAERQIERALDEMVQDIGPGWLLSIDVGAIDVSTLEGRRWAWRATIEARLHKDIRP